MLTIDYKLIQKWVEERNGKPATVKGTGGGMTGVLRVNFPGYGREETLEDINWDEFFEKFEEKKLAFLYQEKTAKGDLSRFNKFVSRKSSRVT